MLNFETTLSEKEVIEQAGFFLGGLGYSIKSQNGSTSFYEGGRDFSAFKALILFFFGIIPGIAYLALCRNKQIMVQAKRLKTKTQVHIVAQTNNSGHDAFALQSYFSK